jgi:hypothetical protein
VSGVAEQHLGEGDDVDAEVEQRPAAEREVEQPVGGVVLPLHAEVGLHRADLADRAVGDQLAQPTTAGWKRVHIASMTKTPVSRARSTTSRRRPVVAVNAFSTSSALPARSAASAIAWCCGCGVAT